MLNIFMLLKINKKKYFYLVIRIRSCYLLPRRAGWIFSKYYLEHVWIWNMQIEIQKQNLVLVNILFQNENLFAETLLKVIFFFKYTLSSLLWPIFDGTLKSFIKTKNVPILAQISQLFQMRFKCKICVNLIVYRLFVHHLNVIFLR